MVDNKKEPYPVRSPEKLTGIKLKPPADFAAGLQSVSIALEHAVKEVGLVNAFRALARLNQKKGFDCPSCAWPDPDDKRSVLGEYCENGAKAVAEEATKKRVSPDFFSKYPVAELAQWSDYQIGKSGRLTHPMILRPGHSHYSPISWEDAFTVIANHLNSLSSPDQAVFYTSGRSSNEAAFLFGLFVRAFGTNNMPDCSNMCHESSGVALKQTLGIGKGSVILEDFEKAEVVIIIGQNPGTNHPRMLQALQKCKNNGGMIISVNPLEEAGLKRFKNPKRPIDYLTSGTRITDIFLQVKINQDVALLKAIMYKLYLMERKHGNVFDHDFINEYTSHHDGFIQHLLSFDLNDLIHKSGVSETEIDKAVEVIASRKKIIICWAMGLTQHRNGVDNIKECVNLLLLKGSLGREGAGICPVRGHSNVQGDRTVGIMSKVSPKLNASIKNVFGFDPPQREGLDTVHSIQAMHKGKVKVFISLGGNFAAAASDTYYTAEALSKCELTVSISTKLNRTHLIPGKTSIILPTMGRSEKDARNGRERIVTVEDSVGKVHASRGHLKPASEHLMSEPDIVAHLAHMTIGNRHGIDWITLCEDYDEIRKKIAEVISGFDQYTEKIKDGEGFYLPNNIRMRDFSNLPGGKAQFSICPLPDHHLEEDEFLLTTIRSHDQFNTTIYGLDDRYRGIYNERRVILINPEDMAKHQLTKLQLVDLVSHYDGVKRAARKFHLVPYNIPRQNLAGYFPEMNPLVPNNHFAEESHTPISKSVKVKILPA